jgi:hypothetical protein
VERLLAGLGSATPSELLPLVYDDVAPQLHALASYSLLAHLIRLQEEGRAEFAGWPLAVENFSCGACGVMRQCE